MGVTKGVCQGLRRGVYVNVCGGYRYVGACEGVCVCVYRMARVCVWANQSPSMPVLRPAGED